MPQKPTALDYDEVLGRITHSGTRAGFLYVIDEPLRLEADIYPHPRTTMDRGVEFLEPAFHAMNTGS